MRLALLFNHSVVFNSLNPVDCSPPGSSVHGDFQTRILEQVTTSFFRGSSQPRDQIHVSYKPPALQADSLPLSHWWSQWFLIKLKKRILIKKKKTKTQVRTLEIKENIQYPWQTRMQNNPQQIIGKSNSTTHWKDHVPWSSRIYSQGCKNIDIHKLVSLSTF